MGLKGNQGTLHEDVALFFDEPQGVAWPGLRSIAKVESRREWLAEGKVEEETRYSLSSLPGEAQQIGEAVRSHWGVENGLHWSLP